MANRYDITKPVADQLRAVRDDHLMATPDKADTAYAVMTRGVDTLAELLEALVDVQQRSADLVAAVLSGDRREMLIAANAINERYPVRSKLISKALGEGQ